MLILDLMSGEGNKKKGKAKRPCLFPHQINLKFTS
jgi:hypothetical protein